MMVGDGGAEKETVLPISEGLVVELERISVDVDDELGINVVTVTV